MIKPMQSVALKFTACCCVCLLACTPSREVSKYDYTYLYDESQALIDPEIHLYHYQADSSLLYFRLESKNLLFGRIGSDTNNASRILMKYKFFDYTTKALLDSATLAYTARQGLEDQSYFEGQLTVPVDTGSLFYLTLAFRDEYKDLNVLNSFIVDKRINGNRQFYRLTDSLGNVIFHNFIGGGQMVRIERSDLLKATPYSLDTSQKNFNMAPPPFIESFPNHTINYQFDHKIPKLKDSTLYLDARHNRLSSMEHNFVPFYINVFDTGYPQISRLDQMIDPVRYISTTNEYNKLKNSLNRKKELDQFWLYLGKDEETTKRLIKEYYTRVENANRYFTTYREGWKTDRGIIYIVFGKPTTVYKSLFKEVWIYGEENNILSIRFEFNKVDSAESDNIFRLERSAEYKNSWYRAVDDWRQARVNI
jgi:GWxTD domain-containing protein